MPQFLTTGTLIECTMGAFPTAFVADELPGAPKENGLTVATIVQTQPAKNIWPFGMCKSLGNPAVSTATTTAQGTLTPMPCTPLGTAWAPPAVTAKVLGAPLASTLSVCICSFGGLIKVKQALPAVGTTS